MEIAIQSSSNPFRILSIDGGGLRGIIAVKILEWIEQNILGNNSQGKPKKIIDSFDLFAGTSTGGLIACALTVTEKNAGNHIYTTSEIVDLYTQNGEKIFPFPKHKLQKYSDWLYNKFRPKHSPSGLTSTLNLKMSGKRILDCRKNIFIPTYNVARFKPIYFTSRVAKEAAVTFKKNAYKFNCSLVDICLATSAAPTYFPSYEFGYSDSDGFDELLNCIDGGVYLNNPALAAYIEVISNPLYYRGLEEIKNEDIFILSIGTGKVSKQINSKSSKNWGEISWAKNVVNAAMQGNSQTIEDQLHKILPDGRYLRINLDIDPKYSELDDSSPRTFDYLNEIIEKEFKQNQSWNTQLLSFKNLANL